MDKTPEYTLMCKKADEIQAEWKHDERTSGDYYFNEKLGAVYVITDIDQKNEDCVWIPRLDQLFKIMQEASNDTPTNVLVDMGNRITSASNLMFEYYILFDTIEKIMLAYIMRDLYEKRWNRLTNNWEKEQ